IPRRHARPPRRRSVSRTHRRRPSGDRDPAQSDGDAQSGRGHGVDSRPSRRPLLRRHRRDPRTIGGGDQATRVSRFETRARRNDDERPRGDAVMRAMTCTDYEGWLMDVLAGSADPAERRAGEHAAACADCRRNARELRASWDLFQELPAVEPPVAVREHTRAAVLELMAAERAQRAQRTWRETIQVPLAVGSGLLVAAATLSL